MKAVIYARYSSDNQREESIEGQIRECTAFAEKNGITTVSYTHLDVYKRQAWHTSRQFSLPLHSLVVPCVLPLIFPSRASVRP